MALRQLHGAGMQAIRPNQMGYLIVRNSTDDPCIAKLQEVTQLLGSLEKDLGEKQLTPSRKSRL